MAPSLSLSQSIGPSLSLSPSIGPSLSLSPSIGPSLQLTIAATKDNEVGSLFFAAINDALQAPLSPLQSGEVYPLALLITVAPTLAMTLAPSLAMTLTMSLSFTMIILILLEITTQVVGVEG